MKRAVEPPDVPVAKPENCAALENPAVARCCEAWRSVYLAMSARGETAYAARRDAGRAYMAALPALSGSAGIRDFIACVAYGMAVEIVYGPSAEKLLSAAKIALSALPRPPATRASRAA